MEYYSFKLQPAHPHADVDFLKIENEQKIFTAAAELCNEGVSYCRDGKRIRVESVSKDALTVTLSSLVPLPNAGRSLSAFSRAVLRLDRDHVMQDCIYFNSVFRNQLLETRQGSGPDISDTELMKAVIDLLFSNSLAYTHDPQKREATIAELKKILQPYISNASALSED